jgi:hypothetical protein
MNDKQETDSYVEPVNDLEEGDFDIEPLTPEQRERVLKALPMIEQAQRLLADVGELLCQVPYLDPQWESLRALYFQVRDCWHAIDNKLPFLTS